MGRIAKYAETSSLMNINITYGEETFYFNLFAETTVDENKINHEAKVQPSAYGFIAMLHKKLIRVAKDKKAEMEKTFSKLYIQYKKQIDEETKRPYPKETAHHMATKHFSYHQKIKEYHQAEENAGIIEACVKSFEQRSYLIQTISANVRKER